MMSRVEAVGCWDGDWKVGCMLFICGSEGGMQYVYEIGLYGIKMHAFFYAVGI